MILAIALALLAQAPETKAPGWTPAESMKVRSVGAVQPSPDGRRAVFTVTEAVMTADKSEMLTHLWVSDGDGAAEQVSDVKSDISAFRLSPDGQWIAYVRTDEPSPAEEQAKREKTDVKVV